MSDEIEFDAEGNEIQPAPKGPAALRAAYDALKARLEVAEQKAAAADKLTRKSTLAELLEEAGAPKRLARYADPDIAELSKDSVLSWLTENGEDFGWAPPDSDEEPTEAEQSSRRISNVTTRAPQSGNGSGADLLHKYQSMTGAQLKEQGLI